MTPIAMFFTLAWCIWTSINPLILTFYGPRWSVRQGYGPTLVSLSISTPFYGNQHYPVGFSAVMEMFSAPPTIIAS